jgi:exportin-1
MWSAVARRCYLSHGIGPDFYAPFFSQVRRVFIAKMERPEDVVVVEDTTGQMVRAETRDTVNAELYRVMHEGLVFLTNLDSPDTLAAIGEQLELLRAEWSDARLNSITWSVGAISGALPVQEERAFLRGLLKQLIEMNHSAQALAARTFLAEGIMFVCSQYPRFLADNPGFMRAVLDKLFDFMQHEVAGVREMAVHTFRAIAGKCRRQFLSGRDQEPLIVAVLKTIDGRCAGLSPDLIVELYGAVAGIISGVEDEGARAVQGRDLMAQLTQWHRQISVDDFANVECVRKLAFVLQANVEVAQALGSAFRLQFEQVFPMTIEMFQHACLRASDIVQETPHYERYEFFTLYTAVGAAFLELLVLYIRKVTLIGVVTTQILPRVIDTVIPIYPQVPPGARQPKTLAVLAELATRLKEQLAVYVLPIWENVIHPSMALLQEEIDTFPDLRLEMAGFLDAFVKSCPDTLLTFPAEELDAVVAMLEMGARHPGFDICRSYLKVLHALVGMVEIRAQAQFKARFFAMFFDRMLQTAFEVMADTVHKFAFQEQVQLIRKMLSIPCQNNRPERLAEMLFANFQTHGQQFYLQLAAQMIESVPNEVAFRQGMKDFLILVKQYSSADADLNSDEIRARNEEISEVNRQVPGLMGPAEVNDEEFLA